MSVAERKTLVCPLNMGETSFKLGLPGCQSACRDEFSWKRSYGGGKDGRAVETDPAEEVCGAMIIEFFRVTRDETPTRQVLTDNVCEEHFSVSTTVAWSFDCQQES